MTIHSIIKGSLLSKKQRKVMIIPLGKRNLKDLKVL